MRAADGAIIEISEWADETYADKAHTHPTVGELWRAMGNVAGFNRLADLYESETPFYCDYLGLTRSTESSSLLKPTVRP